MAEKTYQPLGSGPFGRQALGLPDPTSASPASEAPDMEAARRLADSPYRVPPDDSSSLLHVTRHLFWCDEVCKFIRAFQALDKPPSPPNEAVAAGHASESKLRGKIAELVYRCKTEPARDSHDSDVVAGRILDMVAAAIRARKP